MTNCVNCGAILHGNKCEYCGTEYGNEEKCDSVEIDCWVDCDGVIHRNVPKPQKYFD